MIIIFSRNLIIKVFVFNIIKPPFSRIRGRHSVTEVPIPNYTTCLTLSKQFTLNLFKIVDL